MGRPTRAEAEEGFKHALVMAEWWNEIARQYIAVIETIEADER